MSWVASGASVARTPSTSSAASKPKCSSIFSSICAAVSGMAYLSGLNYPNETTVSFRQLFPSPFRVGINVASPPARGEGRSPEMSAPTRRRCRRHRHARRGFIVIFGWRVLSTRERTPPVVATCPNCQAEEARLVGRLRRSWVTLFFIPVLPLESAYRAQRISQCLECRTTFEMPVEQLARKARAGTFGGTANFADAIALYNQLRDRPTDGATMLALLKTYEALREPGEA